MTKKSTRWVRKVEPRKEVKPNVERKSMWSLLKQRWKPLLAFIVILEVVLWIAGFGFISNQFLFNPDPVVIEQMDGSECVAIIGPNSAPFCVEGK